MSTGVVMMMGSHPRHFAVARSLKEGGHLRAMVVEQREDFVPEPDPSWDPHYQELFRLHFEKRRLAEKEALSWAGPANIGKREGAIIIGTSALEQSLDIDFDIDQRRGALDLVFQGSVLQIKDRRLVGVAADSKARLVEQEDACAVLEPRDLRTLERGLPVRFERLRIERHHVNISVSGDRDDR